MKKTLIEKPFIEYIKENEHSLLLPLHLIGTIPYQAIQDITKTNEYKNADKAQLILLNAVDDFWYKMVYWIAFYRIGHLDRRLAPLSLKEFRKIESFGKLYAYQLELTIQYHLYKGYLPEFFNSPLEWWLYQILEIKNDWYYTVFYPTDKTKTEVVKVRKKITNAMKGKISTDNLSSLSFLTQDLIKRCQSFAYGCDRNSKYLKKYLLNYHDIYKEVTETITKKDAYGTLKIATAKNGNIYLSNQNNRRKIVIQN